MYVISMYVISVYVISMYAISVYAMSVLCHVCYIHENCVYRNNYLIKMYLCTDTLMKYLITFMDYGCFTGYCFLVG